MNPGTALPGTYRPPIVTPLPQRVPGRREPLTGGLRRGRALICGLAALALCAADARPAAAGAGDWQHYRSFGGRTPLGRITSLAADARYVYAFTATGGARYDKLKDEWDFSFPRQTPAFAADFTAHDRYTGDIYFVAGSRLHPFSPRSGIWYPAIAFPAAVRQLAFEDRSIAARTDRGIYLCDRWNSAVTASERDPSSFAWVNAGGLDWARNDGRLSFLWPYSLQDRWALVHPLSALAFEPATEYVWAAYDGMGLWRYDLLTRRGEQVTRGFLASQDVIAAWGDGSRVGLAGRGGVTLYDEAGGQWQQLDRLFNLDLATREIRALAFDRSDILIGTGDGLVALRSGDDFARVLTRFDGLPDSRVNCLALSGDSLWVGTGGGLALCRRPYGRAARTWNELRRVIVNGIATAGGNVYLATNRGAFWLDGRDSLKPRRFPAEDPAELRQELRAVAADGDAVWWLAPEALLRLDPASGGWRRLPRAGGYAAGQGLALAADTANVWVGTDAGLARYDKAADAWRTYHAGDGLLDEAVPAVWSQGGHVWCGGASGASRFQWDK